MRKRTRPPKVSSINQSAVSLLGDALKGGVDTHLAPSRKGATSTDASAWSGTGALANANSRVASMR